MSKSLATILLVEDDPTLGYLLREYLTMNGFKISLAKTASEALQLLDSHIYELAILDVMLPEMDGFHLAKEIRKINKQIPIIFLTARSLQEDKIQGLKLGADDYITKPFNVEELCLKIEIFLKRNTVFETGKKNYQIGKYKFNVDEQLLTLGEAERKLTIKETRLLNLLLQKQNSIIKRESILLELWGKDDYFLGRSLDVFISRLRKYLKEEETIHIENIRGVGFKLNMSN